MILTEAAVAVVKDIDRSHDDWARIGAWLRGVEGEFPIYISPDRLADLVDVLIESGDLS